MQQQADAFFFSFYAEAVSMGTSQPPDTEETLEHISILSFITEK